VVVPVDGDASPANRKLSPRDKLALDALTNCALDRGKPPPFGFGLPSGLLAVEIDQWREEMFTRGILDRKASNPRTDFKRVKESLQVKHLIGIRDDMVWSAVNG
jgi:hypothetical protein